MIYFQQKGSIFSDGKILNDKFNFIDSVNIKDDYNIRNPFNRVITLQYVSLDSIFKEQNIKTPEKNELDKNNLHANWSTSLIFFIIPQYNDYKPNVEIEKIDTLDKFNKFKENVDWTTYTKPENRVVNWWKQNSKA